MRIIETGLDNLFIIEPNIFGDDRGYFFESYNKKLLQNKGIQTEFIQDNEALSAKNIFRGFHYQLPPFAQAKLVRVICGSVLDIVIDIRPLSSTYKKVFQLVLSGQNKKQLYVPEGFAHGYLSLEDNTVFSYKVNQNYNQESERGISYLDPSLSIDWPSEIANFITSEKDKNNPVLGKHTPYE